MNFALLGDHPDGLDMARALEESGRHRLLAYSGSPVGVEYLSRWGARPRVVLDLEEVLADPAIEAVIVAGRAGIRSAQLRRALQSERHVLCVHPIDDSPDVAYEAGLLQQDAGCVLLPILAEALHPGIRRLAELVRREGFAPTTAITASAHAVTTQPAPEEPPRSTARLLEIERWTTEEVVLSSSDETFGLPGWDTLRLLGGEVAEVFAQGSGTELDDEAPLVLSGLFVRGGLFQATLLPFQSENRLRIALVTTMGRAELVFPQGWPGPARLTYRDDTGVHRDESWEPINPWLSLVEIFENALTAPKRRETSLTTSTPELGWQDEIRALELDDAARRSVHRRRASTLEYMEATEEASFKGTMTLVGCSMLWVSLVLLILSIWLPWLGWLILPVFGVFLLLQLLRLAVPAEKND